jgi:hypothetical protein
LSSAGSAAEKGSGRAWAKRRAAASIAMSVCCVAPVVCAVPFSCECRYCTATVTASRSASCHRTREEEFNFSRYRGVAAGFSRALGPLTGRSA